MLFQPVEQGCFGKFLSSFLQFFLQIELFLLPLLSNIYTIVVECHYRLFSPISLQSFSQLVVLLSDVMLLRQLLHEFLRLLGIECFPHNF